jgi:predicted metal-dependent hydrolase
VGKKSAKIAAMIESFQGRSLDAHYLGYFQCFNEQLYYEAHDVLEELWLGQRRQANDLFYKGLIQLAGAFVHLQKDRLGPAAALFRLAQKNLSQYPVLHEELNVSYVLDLIQQWLAALENSSQNPLTPDNRPFLALED